MASRFFTAALVLALAAPLLSASSGQHSAHADGGSFHGLAFYSDANCSVAWDPSTVAGVNATYTAWTSLPSSAFVVLPAFNFTDHDSGGPPCIANPLPAYPLVASGEYACWNDDPSTGTRGFGAAEFMLPGCDTTAAQNTQFQRFLFSGPHDAACVAGYVATRIQTAQGRTISRGASRTVYATWTCANNGGSAVRLGSSPVALLAMLLVAVMLCVVHEQIVKIAAVVD